MNYGAYYGATETDETTDDCRLPYQLKTCAAKKVIFILQFNRFALLLHRKYVPK